MRIHLIWLALGILSAAPLPADTATVLYPRSPSPEHPAAASPAPVGFTTSALVVVAGAAAGWLLWRKLRSGVRPSRGPQQLAIAETRSLGNRQFLVVATYGERKFLLGVCPGRVDLLSPLDGSPPPPVSH